MDDQTKTDWNSSWKKGFTPWHSHVPNQHLVDCFDKLIDGSECTGKSILVPMCGKSVDLLWLYENGFNVVGSELSEVAVKLFFEENSLAYTVEDVSPEMKVFVHDSKLKIIQGDIFKLTPMLALEGQQFEYIWDCHAMSALPYNLQNPYMDHIRTLLRNDARGLVNSFEYDPTKMEGPPCSMTPDVMERLLGKGYKYELIEKVPSKDVPNRPVVGIGEFSVVYLYQCV